MELRVNREVRDAIGNGSCLSTSLRIGKFAKVGGRVKKPAVDWVCKGRMEMPKYRLSTIPGCATIKMKTMDRLIVNQSGGVLENANLALHPHFGCPFISGSAVKGVARHAAWCEWDDTEEGEDKDALAIILSEVFGFPTGESSLHKELGTETGKRSGSISFLPALPVSGGGLEADIVNSHQGERPIPVFFPAVKAGTVFEFVMRPLNRDTRLDADDLLIFAESWLKTGLEHYGAGAKSGAGYGWFEEVEDE